MVCLVKDSASGKLFPSCSAVAADAMSIETGSEDVHAARRTALELLLSDHLGDCEGPCRRACPSDINIPLMIRQIARGAFDEAGRTVALRSGPLCAPVDGRPPPCERVCRRNQIDTAVSICLLCRFAVQTGPQPEMDAGSSGNRFAKRFNSVMGRMRDDEKPLLMEGVGTWPRVEPEGGAERGFSADEATREAGRCMHCDCRKSLTCKLRQYAQEYGARQARYKAAQRRLFEHVTDHPDVIFEQGKCIACGICVRVAARHGEELGLSFVGRGIGTRLRVPFGEPLTLGLRKSARSCVEACPTGALAFRLDKPPGES
jgi:ferredoxin